MKGKGEKERYTHLHTEFQRIARKDKKDFLSEQCKEIQEKNRRTKTGDLFKKVKDTKRTFQAKMGTTKDRNGMDLTEAEEIKKRGKNTQNNYTKMVLMTQKTTMVWSLTSSQTSWNVKSSGPYEASLRTKLVDVMEFQLTYFKS